VQGWGASTAVARAVGGNGKTCTKPARVQVSQLLRMAAFEAHQTHLFFSFLNAQALADQSVAPLVALILSKVLKSSPIRSLPG
jgi:ABC-type enterochelin transport system permease subunit